MYVEDRLPNGQTIGRADSLLRLSKTKTIDLSGSVRPPGYLSVFPCVSATKKSQLVLVRGNLHNAHPHT